MNQKLQFMKRNISYLLSTILVLENIEFIRNCKLFNVIEIAIFTKD